VSAWPLRSSLKKRLEVSGGTEDHSQSIEHELGIAVGDAVVDRLAIATERDQPVLAEEGKVLRESRLAQADRAGQLADRRFACRGELAQDEKPPLVGKQLEQAGCFRGSRRQLIARLDGNIHDAELKS